jgi:hypothetical protein
MLAWSLHYDEIHHGEVGVTMTKGNYIYAREKTYITLPGNYSLAMKLPQENCSLYSTPPWRSISTRGSRFLPCDLFQVDLEPGQKSKINLLNTFFCILSGSLRKWHFWSPKSKKST